MKMLITSYLINFMRFTMQIKSVLLTLSALAFSFSASAASISTGVAGWLVNGIPVAVETTLAVPSWINNFGDGKWVGTTANDGSFSVGANPGTYTFTLLMAAYAGGPSGAFSLQYAADNTVAWTISGGGSLSGATACSGDPTTTDCFGSTAGAPRTLSGLYAATSLLTATVVNGGTSLNPMGLLVVGTATPANVPLPSSLAILALGGAVLGAMRARRQKA